MRNKNQILRSDQTTCEEMIYTALGEMVAGWSTS